MAKFNHQNVLDAIPPFCRQALSHLLQVHEAAFQERCDPWQFACQLPHLLAQGISDTALRWLLRKGYAEHRTEASANAEVRAFRVAHGLHLERRSCFILTSLGVRAAQQLALFNVHVVHVPSAPHPIEIAINRPHWDADDRTLWLSDAIVKRFRVPAQNQELILSALEEEKWPRHLDDPLPPQQEIDSRRRLHDTIKGLNRNQLHVVLHFEGDGTGCGIRWRLLVL